MGTAEIATGWGGPADYLDEASGILIGPTSYGDLVAGFAEAMTKLMNSPELAKSMGVAGHKRAVRDFDWQKKIQQMISIYRALEDRTERHREVTGRTAVSSRPFRAAMKGTVERGDILGMRSLLLLCFIPAPRACLK